MNARSVDQSPAIAAPVLVGEQEFIRRRIERALRQRRRYRYTRPGVALEAGGWQISSPCCSRTVAADGGVIEIARIERVDGWLLYRRDHTQNCWQLHAIYADLGALLLEVCSDGGRLFWP